MITSRITSRKSRGQVTAYGTLLAISVVLMVISGSGLAREMQSAASFGFRPIIEGLNNAADSVGSVWSAIDQIGRLRVENDELRQENDALRRELARMPAIQHLNDDWTAITQTQQFITYKTTTARVLTRDLTDLRPRTIVLDKGSDDGIQLGHVVIAAGGALVGRVETVGRSTSQVRLISDAASVVTGVTVPSSSDQGTATGEIAGQSGGYLQMRNVDASAALKEGQEVVTAGYALGDIRSPFPPGLLIGRVLDVTHDPNAVVQTAFVQADVDFSHLDYVLVILNYQGGIQAAPSASPSPSVRPSASPSRKPTPVPTKR